MTDLIFYGTKVREARTKLKIKQGVFAEGLGISSNYLSTIETQKQPPTLKLIDALIKTYNVSPYWFFLNRGEMIMKDQDVIEEGQADLVEILKAQIKRFEKQEKFYQERIVNLEDQVAELIKLIPPAKRIKIQT